MHVNTHTHTHSLTHTYARTRTRTQEQRRELSLALLNEVLKEMKAGFLKSDEFQQAMHVKWDEQQMTLDQLILISGGLNSASDKDTKSHKDGQESAKKKVEKHVTHEVGEITDSTRYACAWVLMSAIMSIFQVCTSFGKIGFGKSQIHAK